MARTPDLVKRAEIAEQSFEFIRTRGFQKRTMRDIAKALGMKRSTLYWYYRDLGGIFEAVAVGGLGNAAIDLGLGRARQSQHPRRGNGSQNLAPH